MGPDKSTTMSCSVSRHAALAEFKGVADVTPASEAEHTANEPINIVFAGWNLCLELYCFALLCWEGVCQIHHLNIKGKMAPLPLIDYLAKVITIDLDGKENKSASGCAKDMEGEWGRGWINSFALKKWNVSHENN